MQHHAQHVCGEGWPNKPTLALGVLLQRGPPPPSSLGRHLTVGPLLTQRGVEPAQRVVLWVAAGWGRSHGGERGGDAAGARMPLARTGEQRQGGR